MKQVCLEQTNRKAAEVTSDWPDSDHQSEEETHGRYLMPKHDSLLSRGVHVSIRYGFFYFFYSKTVRCVNISVFVLVRTMVAR